MTLNRKWESIDLMTLYAECSHKQWNKYLSLCVVEQNVQILEKTYYGIQSGMDDLARQKLNSQKIINWYLRLAKSIENTAKTIYRAKYPSTLDDPVAAQSLKGSLTKEFKKQLQIKRNRDANFEIWLKKVRF